MQRLVTLVFIFVLTCSTVLHATPAEYSISDIQITAGKDQEKIQLIFESEYGETVSTDFETGLVQLTLPNTTFDPSLAFINVNDRFIRNIRLIGISNGSILEIHFADPEFDAIGMIKEGNQGESFDVLISKTTKFAIESPEEILKPQVAETDQSSAPDSLSSSVSFLDSDMTINIVKMLVALFLLLVFFYLLLWAYNRFFATRFRFNKGKYDIKVSSSYHLSPKQKIVVLEVNGLAYACGVTANNISVISKVSRDSFSDYLSNLDLHNNKDISFAEIRMQYLQSKKKQETLQNSVSSDSKFASELIQRIKNLKPLD